jgi:hypothetical protein
MEHHAPCGVGFELEPALGAGDMSGQMHQRV